MPFQATVSLAPVSVSWAQVQSLQMRFQLNVKWWMINWSRCWIAQKFECGHGIDECTRMGTSIAWHCKQNQLSRLSTYLLKFLTLSKNKSLFSPKLHSKGSISFNKIPSCCTSARDLFKNSVQRRFEPMTPLSYNNHNPFLLKPTSDINFLF